MARRPPEKRIYNIRLYLNACILLDAFKSDASPPQELTYPLREQVLGPRQLVFGNPWYNEAHDTFEYSLLRKE